MICQQRRIKRLWAREVEQSDAVLILGEDPTNSAPMLDLALRQAAIQKPKEMARKIGIPAWHDGAVREVVQLERGPFFIATPDQIKLDSEATATYRAAPNDISRLGFAIAHELDSQSPAVTDLNRDALKLAAKDLRVAEAGKTADHRFRRAVLEVKRSSKPPPT